MKKSENFSIQMKDQFKVIGLCLLLFVACKSKEPELNNPTAPTSQTAPSGADPGLSSVTATIAGPYTANGVDEIIVDVVMKDSFNRPLYEVKPQFSITNTDGKNIIDCTPSNLAGESRCRIRSTRAEVKTISLSYPFSQYIGVATYVHDVPAAVGINTQPHLNGVAGQALATQPIAQVFDAYGNPVFTAVNTVTAAFFTDSSCTVASTGGNVGTLSVVGDGSTSLYPFVGLGNELAEVQYVGFTSPGLTPACSRAVEIVNEFTYSLHIETQPSATAVAGELFTQFPVISIRDQFNNLALQGGMEDAVVTVTPFQNSNCTGAFTTGEPGLVGLSPLTSDNGLSLAASNAVTPPFQLRMYRKGNLYLRFSTPGILDTVCANAVNVSPDVIDVSRSEIRAGSGQLIGVPAGAPTAANGVHESDILIFMRDQYYNGVQGEVPTYTVGGTNNTASGCTASNVNGRSTCTLRSTTVENKTITSVTPFVLATTSNFITPPDAAESSIVAINGPWIANNTGTNNIQITLEDAGGSPIVGIRPRFTASGTGNTISSTSCSISNASGISTCTLRSTVAEEKTLSISVPFAMVGGTVIFEPGAVSGANSTITGTGPVTADDVETSTITIILRDQFNNIVPGVTPTFAATDTDATNTYGACSVGDVNGESTCTLRSRRAEVKTLQLVTPDTTNGGNVTFEAGLADAGNSSITGTSPVFANGSANSQIEITLIDQFMNPLVGEVPTFSANLGLNNYGACSAADATGVSQCTMSSSVAGLKDLQLTSPISFTGGNVNFSSAALLVAHGTSASEDYGNVTVDTSRSYVVTNTATHSSGLLSVVFTPDNGLYWGLVDGCTNDDLAQNDICSIQVNFLGDSAPPGAYTATLEVSSLDAGNITFNLQVVRDP